MTHSDVSVPYLVVGTGIAGLVTALECAESSKVLLVSKSILGESNTRYAQGGIAAAWGRTDDCEQHFNDTMAAGCNHNNADHVRVLTSQSRAAIEYLLKHGVQFDRAANDFALAREGAHSHARVLHYKDRTGEAIIEPLLSAVRQHSNIDILEHMTVLELALDQGRCVGAYLRSANGEIVAVSAQQVFLATGGAGQLYEHTSNPQGATGDGMVLAHAVGAELADMEFVQFHPTSVLLDESTKHYMLLSEALRGAGARLVLAAGQSIMQGNERDLASRDVVSRAIFRQMQAGKQVYLDVSMLADNFSERFPTLAKVLLKQGLDLQTDLVPIFPTAHYIMGGIKTDIHAQTRVPGLYAIGEVACSGVHGANRLASNSLLEGIVFGLQAAKHAIAQHGVTQPTLPSKTITCIEPLSQNSSIKSQVQQLMWTHCGITRHPESLKSAISQLQTLLNSLHTGPNIHNETANFVQLAIFVMQAAYKRPTSLGAHWVIF